MDDNTTVAAVPDDNVLLNDQSLVYGSDMQMDPAEEDDGSWHIRSTPPYSNGPYPDGIINRANSNLREDAITQSENPQNEEHDEERADPVAAELPTRQEIYNWVEEESLDEGEKLARRIVYILTAGLVSCPADQHRDQDATHLATCRRHLHLRETWAGSSARVSGLSFAEREEQSRQFGLDRTVRPLDASVTGLRRDQLPPASRLEAQFAGWHEDKDWSDAEVCLHRDDVPQRKLAPAVHDIDSFLHVTKDPRSLRGPLNICITAQPSLLLSKSIHVRVPIRVGEKIKQVPIYQIPHTVLAHQRPRTVYMFFPRLYDEKCRKKGPVPLREEQNRLFFDGFIRPSIEKIGPQFVHHLPGSYDSVRAASRIAMESSGSAAVRGAAFEVPYSEENLPRLWSVMQEALNRAERDIAADGSVRETEDASRLWQFGDAIFLCSYKDTKLWHQSSGSSIAGVLGNFRARCGVVSLEQEPTANTGSGNPPYEDDRTEPTPWRQTQLVDVASELLPTRSGHTVLARRCCQYNTLRFLYGQSEEALLGRTALRVEGEADNDWDNEASSSQEDEEGEGEHDPDEDDRRAPRERGSEEEQTAGEGWKPPRIPRAVTTEYPVHMLRDSISITSEPRRTSPIFKHGVSYIQSYTVEEGNFNVAAIWAFSHPNIFNLAHSDEAWAAVARKGNIKASRQDAERALSQSIQRMASNLEDPSRGYGWRVELRITTTLAAQLRPAEEAWWRLIKRANRLSDGPGAVAVTPDRNAFYVLAAGDFNAFVRQNIDKHLRLMDYIMSYWARDPSTPQSAASLYAIVTLALRHFVNHQPHALARILSAPLVVGARSKIGLDMARSREQRGFAFFPKDVVDWHELRLHDWATDLLQVPQLVIKAHWLEEASLRQSRHLIDQVISLAVSKDIRTREQAEEVLGILSQLLIRSYKESAYLALFPAKGRRKRVPDMDVFEFTLAGVRAESRAVQGRDCNPPGNHRFFIKHVSTYFAWAWTLADSDISRGHLESQHFRVEAKRAIKAFEQLSRSPFITAQRFLCVLYYCFCQQVLCFPNPDKINGVMSVTAKNGSRTVLCTHIIKPCITIPDDAKLTDTVAAIVLNQDPDTHPQQSAYLSNIIYSIKQIRRYLHLPLSEYDL
ncbi:uncharacterized protein B0J16DRAFT_383561 [Fusarium flagelliforme]|uniref:uncharacterized protein n=1 Tax=Fusarium flagelliforme TaxID=2675880 RepID=UPI001E8E6CF3|nr:uncharacterized protein B0J16DRAFT_390128 [Fusarium flagelliforme]XP_045982146.1 uncharacterized protein B0J16DRAFT_383561 [Fusarium flagelliforme]KAH7169649.1 hypothetical protein B0J16DRAFT_390128 [Fusarium flagelliforme]KAH7184514.1 hypothetical protein B0J16DRAFT_383561 [Fusarium flagelliforme]